MLKDLRASRYQMKTLNIFTYTTASGQMKNNLTILNHMTTKEHQIQESDKRFQKKVCRNHRKLLSEDNFFCSL